MTVLLASIKSGVIKGLRTALMLLCIVIPIYLAVTLLRHTDLFSWLSEQIEPVMRLFGLPGEAVVPIIVGFFADEYAVVAAMSGLSFSMAQITVIVMITLCFHSIPVETAVAQKIGMPSLKIAAFRLGFAVLTGIVVSCMAALFLGGDAPMSVLTQDTRISGTLTDTIAHSAAGDTLSAPADAALFDAGFEQILPEMGMGVLSVVINLLRVIIPLMIVIEYMLARHIVEILAKKLEPVCWLLGIGKDALLPLLIGLLLGVTYGAGALAEMNRTKPLARRDMTLLAVFLFSCHGIIETAYLFTVAGANIFFVSLLRLALAICITAVAARILPQGRRERRDLR